MDEAIAPFQNFRDLRGERPVPEGKARSRPKFFPGADQTLPGVFAPGDQQHHLAGAAAGLPLPDEAGRQDPGIVQDQTVPRTEKLGKVIKMMVPGLPCFFI